MPSRSGCRVVRRGALAVLILLTAACSRARPATTPEPAASAPAVPVRPGKAAVAERPGLMVPVQGMPPSRVKDTYTAGRGGGRTHDAVDIMAPRGTPVLAADDGLILKLRQNDAGGITIYQLDGSERFIYYYAHLQGYRRGLAEGERVRQGDLIGYVGTTGNAPDHLPHLHFQVMKYRGNGQYWGGEPVNPAGWFVRAGKR